MSDTLADRLAAFALATRFEDLPEAVVVEARRRLLDSLGCAVGALAEPAPTIARRVAGRTRGTPSVALIGGGPVRARLGGVRQRRAYPLPRLQRHVSLARAGAPERQLGGRDGRGPARRRRRPRAWIAAAAVAYEVQCRLCDAASIRARGWDHTTYGSLSATLAALEAAGALARADRPRAGDRRDDRDRACG